MYAYYFCRLVGIKVPRVIKKNLTSCQMLQFAVCAAHAMYCIYNQYLVVCALIQLFVMVNMLFLFGQFYKKSYSKKATDKAGSEKAQ
jgi:elongation of very long chain fatty acids protein 4